MNDDATTQTQPAIDDQFLAAMGIEVDGMEEEQKQQALEDILFTLNMNVGNRVADSLNDQQSEEFEALLAKDDNDEEIGQWLQQNVPNYQQMIEEEAAKMKEQGSDIVDQIMKEREP